MIFGADLDLKVKIVADLPAHRFHDLQKKARAVYERPAVLILTIIDGGAEKLID